MRTRYYKSLSNKSPRKLIKGEAQYKSRYYKSPSKYLRLIKGGVENSGQDLDEDIIEELINTVHKLKGEIIALKSKNRVRENEIGENKEAITQLINDIHNLEAAEAAKDPEGLKALLSNHKSWTTSISSIFGVN